MAAVMAAERLAAVQDEGDIAVLALDRPAAGTAVQGRSDAAPVEEQHRLAAALEDPSQLGEQRRRERVPRLAAHVDDAHRRQLAAHPPPELEALERRPALRPRRRRAEHGDGSLERSPLDRDRAGVVAGIRVLLVGGVVLLVDDDQAEAAHGSEHRRAGTDDDARLAARDSLALVSPLGLAEARVEDRHPVAEPCPRTADGLGRERDLGHEQDRAEPPLESRRAGLEVHLGLPRARRPEEQERTARAGVERRHDPIGGRTLLGEQRLRLVLAGQRLALGGRRLLLAAPRQLGRDERERPRRRGAVVGGDPEGEVDERRRHLADDLVDGDRVDPLRGAVLERHDDSPRTPPPELHRHDRALADAFVDLVGERTRDGARRHERVDRRKGHRAGECVRR